MTGVDLLVEYMDEVLRRLATEADHRPVGWGADAVRMLRETIQCVYAAKTDADLRALRSLHMSQRRDDRPGAWSIRLDDARRLVLTFKNDESGATTVLELLDTETECPR